MDCRPAHARRHLMISQPGSDLRLETFLNRGLTSDSKHC
ncbi:hypothetical protein BN2497_12895 [Janthinobacterium sp. CG23_2]|nr:hypothetical protein BN2497_12895 [Janthinobacterium sp. CG23_2]CUU32845.1 hypothetical protein BN3177_12895 [Janthinobacterium sp. CG23_2]